LKENENEEKNISMLSVELDSLRYELALKTLKEIYEKDGWDAFIKKYKEIKESL
jgi:hypothetical protein